MKSVEQVSQVYVKNLLDLYARTIIFKNMMYCINIFIDLNSSNISYLLADKVKKSLTLQQFEFLSNNTDNIDKLLQENMLFLLDRMKKYSNSSPLTSIDISNCQFSVDRNDFSLNKFKNKLNVEKYVYSVDNLVDNSDFNSRIYDFKDKVNIEMFRAYFQFFNNDYKKYFSSLRLGVRLNYIINDQQFLQKFSLNDLKSEEYNKKEKNWILFDNSTPNNFLFSMELLKKESFQFIDEFYTNDQIHDYINDSSDGIFGQLISDLIYAANENISNFYPMDMNDVLTFAFYDIKYETIDNIISNNKDFDKLCFEISTLITNYKNFRNF
jgi:hypothetical protein